MHKAFRLPRNVSKQIKFHDSYQLGRENNSIFTQYWAIQMTLTTNIPTAVSSLNLFIYLFIYLFIHFTITFL